MTGLLSPEGLVRVTTAASMVGVLGIEARPVGTNLSGPIAAETPFFYCEPSGITLAEAYNDNEMGSCFVEKDLNEKERKVVLVEDSQMLTYLIFSVNGGSGRIDLIVFEPGVLHNAAWGVMPEPGESLELEFRGFKVTIDGWNDGYYVTYKWYDKSQIWKNKPNPEKHRDFLPRSGNI